MQRQVRPSTTTMPITITGVIAAVVVVVVVALAVAAAAAALGRYPTVLFNRSPPVVLVVLMLLLDAFKLDSFNVGVCSVAVVIWSVAITESSAQ